MLLKCYHFTGALTLIPDYLPSLPSNLPVPILFCIAHIIFQYSLPSYYFFLVNLSLSLLEHELHEGRNFCLFLFEVVF